MVAPLYPPPIAHEVYPGAGYTREASSVCDFLSCDLPSGDLLSCDLLSCDFLSCDFLSCDFLSCDLLSCDFLLTDTGWYLCTDCTTIFNRHRLVSRKLFARAVHAVGVAAGL